MSDNRGESTDPGDGGKKPAVGRRSANGAPADPLLEAQEATESDQTSADADQSGSDADQSNADADQSNSDADQASAIADQVASDRDQAAANKELAAHPRDTSMVEAHEESRIAREAGTLVRHATTLERANTAQDRANGAAARDQTAEMRDLAAKARDLAAGARDRAAAQLEQGMQSQGPEAAAAMKHATEVRIHAAADRQRAATDREQAAVDREEAAVDRRQVLGELRRAHIDDLTGAYRRGVGEAALQQEVDRARRTGENLIIAYIDVDGLKAINDRDGHMVGDDRLRDVVNAMRSKIRAYEPIVRFGGDEFVCALGGLDVGVAETRFAEVRAILDDDTGSTISVGLATLRPEDTLADLISRADAALVEARHDHPPEGSS